MNVEPRFKMLPLKLTVPKQFTCFHSPWLFSGFSMRLSINLSSKGKAVANFVLRHFGGLEALGPGDKLLISNSQIAGLEGESNVQTSKVTSAGSWVSVTAQECTRQGPGACLLGAAQ